MSCGTGRATNSLVQLPQRLLQVPRNVVIRYMNRPVAPVNGKRNFARVRSVQGFSDFYARG